MQNEFKALLKKDIYAILDGDTLLKVKEEDEEYETIMPYLTGQQLVDLCKTFGLYQQYGASRWTYLEALLKYMSERNRVDELLIYMFDLERFYHLTALSSPELIHQKHKEICNAAIDKINATLALGRHELQLIEGRFYITETGKKVPIETLRMKRIDMPYVHGLAGRCQDDFVSGNYDSVLTKSRTIIEEVLVFILESRNIEPTTSGDIGRLYNQVKTELHMQQDKSYDGRVNSLLYGLERIVESVGAMRNTNSDAHGVGSSRINIAEREARLVMNSTITFCEYLLSIACP